MYTVALESVLIVLREKLRLMTNECLIRRLLSLSLSLSVYGFAALFTLTAVFFGFFILYTVDRTPWTGDQPVARPLLTHRITQTE
jgi:hypothetical protein